MPLGVSSVNVHFHTVALMYGAQASDAVSAASHSGKVTITEDEILVKLRARSKAHYLVAAGYPELRERIPWLGNKMLRVQFSRRP